MRRAPLDVQKFSLSALKKSSDKEERRGQPDGKSVSSEQRSAF